MVGVPGRSKGCHNCRRKKKGCDQQRPSCNQCLKSGLRCEGYDRPRVFVNYHDATIPIDKSALVHDPTSARKKGSVHNHYNGDHPEAILLPDSLAMTAGEQKYVSYFLDLYSPGRRLMSPWAWTASRTTAPATRQALLALSLAMVGKQENDPGMLVQAAKLYGRALKEAAADLESPAKGTSDGTLATVTMMRLYEMFHRGADNQAVLSEIQSHNWRQHSMGTMAIFNARTPWSFVDGLSHHLFVDARLALIIKAIHERKWTPLSGTEWKTIPWTKHEKNAKHALIDVLVEIPGILQDIDRLHGISEDEEKNEECRRLLGLCWVYDHLLTQWHDTTQPVVTCDADDVVLLYWTTCLFLYSSMGLLANKLGHPATHLPERGTNLRQHVDHIAEAIPVFFEDGVAREAMLQAVFPLGSCLQFMFLLEASPMSSRDGVSGTASEKQELAESRARLLAAVCRTEHGKAVMTFLSSLQRDKEVLRTSEPAPTFQGRAKQWVREEVPKSSQTWCEVDLKTK